MYCRRCYVRYVLRTVTTAALLQQVGELRTGIRMYVVYYNSRTRDMYSSSSSTAVMELRICTICTVNVATCSLMKDNHRATQSALTE